MLSACASNCPPPPAPVTVTKTVDTGCKWTRPIYVHAGDELSDTTAQEILAHNKTGAQRCGWKASSSK
ncbi:hypothetical protein J4G52_25080 [Burkholderia cenocepacia]|nr:hypothetical protein [Burkholderia cenocepacia]